MIKKVNYSLLLWFAFAVALLPTHSFGETSQEYAAMGRKLWSAFECAVIAGVANDGAEHQRLFNVGIEQGRTFLNALQAGKITQEDFKNAVPLVVVWLLDGPSVDFILGRIFEAAGQSATEVFQAPDEKLKVTIAQNEYAKRDCSLIR
jgi:hypothetical protein